MNYINVTVSNRDSLLQRNSFRELYERTEDFPPLDMRYETCGTNTFEDITFDASLYTISREHNYELVMKFQTELIT